MRSSAVLQALSFGEGHVECVVKCRHVGEREPHCLPRDGASVDAFDWERDQSVDRPIGQLRVDLPSQHETPHRVAEFRHEALGRDEIERTELKLLEQRKRELGQWLGDEPLRRDAAVQNVPGHSASAGVAKLPDEWLRVEEALRAAQLLPVLVDGTEQLVREGPLDRAAAAASTAQELDEVLHFRLFLGRQVLDLVDQSSSSHLRSILRHMLHLSCGAGNEWSTGPGGVGMHEEPAVGGSP